MKELFEQISVATGEAPIEKILAGDTLLFEMLLRRHNAVLYKIARSHGFNHQDAQDLVSIHRKTADRYIPDINTNSSL